MLRPRRIRPRGSAFDEESERRRFCQLTPGGELLHGFAQHKEFAGVGVS